MRTIIMACLAASVAAPALAQETGQDFSVAFVHTDVNMTNQILNFQEGITDDQEFILRSKAAGTMKKDALYLGGAFRGGILLEWTNEDGKFPLLSRFPDSHGSEDTAQDFIVQNAALSFVAGGDWVSFVGQLEYSETEFRRDQEELQLREAYVIIGDLTKSPFYAAFGRKTIDFGEFNSYNPYVHSVNQHFFWALSDDAVLELGAIGDDWRVSATAIPGTRQLRTALSGDEGRIVDFPNFVLAGGGVETDEGEISNFAVKGKKSFDLSGFAGGSVATFSASYLHDTIYRNNITAHTRSALERLGPPNAPLPLPFVLVEERTGLYNLNATLQNERFDFNVEYTSSTSPWVATQFDDATGLEFPGVRDLQAITVQGRWHTEVMGKPTDFAAVFGRGILGPEDTEFDEADQHALSAEVLISDNLRLGAEYVYLNGFQPFVGVQDVSDTSVESHAVMFGVRGRF